VKTNPKGGGPKSLSPPVPRIGTTRSKPKKTPESTAVASHKTHSTEEIARLAYAFWEARGGIGGSAEDDWYRAEQEIRMRS
jgi:hypothetical protein